MSTGTRGEAPELGRTRSLALLAVIAVSWGVTWPVNKAMLLYTSPIWAVCFRYVAAVLVLIVLTSTLGRLRPPPRRDLPVVLSVSLLHMVGFGVLCSIGLRYVGAGRSVMLAYTTPFWVFPFARVVLGESMTASRLSALASGILGLLLLVNPWSLDWTDADTLTGHAVILLAAILWAASIVLVRRHRWASTPFDLLVWQTLLTTVVTAVLGLGIEGLPNVDIDLGFVVLALFGGGVGTALAFWALNTVNRVLPATTTSLGLLGVPLFGVVCSMVALGETYDLASVAALALIVTGIAIGTLGHRSAA
ncbi:MAG: DMT family transporter [Hyphomicrobiaceae bacterium]|nr:DMT family transporter [Hyphomicrobiaceae bacterium]